MTLLELVIIAHRCRSTHHFITFDALQLIKGPDAADWKNLLLRHHTQLLKGAKAPDAEFKDFKNHVLHVQEGEWGGARDAAMQWYGKAVEALRLEKWDKAAYALGVLTHYYADPIQPFHTGQTEEEGAIHRAVEWSIAKSRDTIKAMIDLRGYPKVHSGKETGFVADMVLAGANYSNPHYQTFIDHYDLHKGVANPEEGLDQTLLDILADLIAYATAGVAELFERAFAEAGVKPQKVDLDLPGYFAALDIPIRKITKRMSDAKDRKTVEAMYEEFVETGKVIKTLPDDDKKIRALHCKHVLRKPLAWLNSLPLKPIGTKHVPLEQRPPARTPTVMPDLEVFEEKAPEIRAPEAKLAPVIPIAKPKPEPTVTLVVSKEPEAAPAVIETAPESAPAEPDPEVEVKAETEPEAATLDPSPTAADAVLAELDAAESKDPKPKRVVAEASKPVQLKADPVLEVEEEPKAERLTLISPVVDAPSIGPKTAARLGKVDIVTIGDLLNADAEQTASALNVRYIKAKTLKDWQDQTRLMVEAPGLRVLDSQILVGAGIRNVNELAEASATKVLKAATSFLDTPQGARVLWGGENTVDKSEVVHWIDLAKSAQG